MVAEKWVFLNAVNAFLWTASRESHYVTFNQLPQEQSAEAATRKSQIATRAIHNRAAAWFGEGSAIFENLPTAQTSVNLR
jgi:hypothetical protein